MSLVSIRGSASGVSRVRSAIARLQRERGGATSLLRGRRCGGVIEGPIGVAKAPAISGREPKGLQKLPGPLELAVARSPGSSSFMRLWRSPWPSERHAAGMHVSQFLDIGIELFGEILLVR